MTEKDRSAVGWGMRIWSSLRRMMGGAPATSTGPLPPPPGIEVEESPLLREQTPSAWCGNLLPTASHLRLVSEHRVLVLAEDRAAEFIPPSPEDTVLVRITNPVDELPALSGRYAAVIECRFYDLESGRTEAETVACLAYRKIAAEAPRLCAFLKRHEGKMVVVHCYQGKARSAAVAQFVLEMRGDEAGIDLLRSDGQIWTPNEWVLRALRSV